MTSSEILAYAAGLIDGEGCIGAYNVRQASSTKSPYAQITVVVGMVTPFAVTLLHDIFGGTLKAAKRSNVRRTVFTWTVRNKQAEACLRWLLPYLREKKEQAEVALALANLRRTRGHTKRLSLEEITERETYVQRLKELKQQEYAATALQ